MSVIPCQRLLQTPRAYDSALLAWWVSAGDRWRLIEAPSPCGSTMLNDHGGDTRAGDPEATSALLRAVNTSDLEAVMAIWDDSGTLMPPGHASVQGHQAIRTYFEQLFKRSRFEFAFMSLQVSVDDALAVEL